MRYIMFIKHPESVRAEPMRQSLMEAMGTYVAEGFKAGWLLDTAGLKGTADGTRVRLADGKIKVTDGPFTEAKEMIGGYALVEAKSKKQAVELATQFMELHRVHAPGFVGECEVRPLEDMG
ncbi:MAG: YciI family protein [Gemmatimonadales bacterium]